MDTPLTARLRDPVSLVGLACCQDPQEASGWLKTRKMIKFMGKQDRLAVAAAALAAKQAGLSQETLQHRTGLYLVSGHIPFAEEDMLPLAQHSTDTAGAFSMELFSGVGLDQVNPLLTFRCLPNMPIFHVSYNLGIQGPSMTSFPGLGQFYQVLEQALWALHEDEIEVALVGAVADQNNFLVDYHWSRVGAREPRPDAAGFLVLRKGPDGLALLRDFSLAYDGGAGPFLAWGPMDLVHQLGRSCWSHQAHTHDGYRVHSEWVPA